MAAVRGRSDQIRADLTFAAAPRLDPGFYADALALSQILAGTADIMRGPGSGQRASANVAGAREEFQRIKTVDRLANDLLCSRLTPVDATVWRQTNRLMRPSRLWPGMEYMIQQYAPVAVIDRGVVTQSLCVVAAKGEPEADRIMTILDLIESDERRLWEMAVATPGHGLRPGLILPPDSTPPYSWHDRLGPLAVFAIGGAIGGTIFLAWVILFG